MRVFFSFFLIFCFFWNIQLNFATFSSKTEYWAIQVHEEGNPHEIAELHGHSVLRQIGALENFYLLKSMEGTIPGITHPHLDTHTHVLWSQKQIPQVRIKRIIGDPLYASQWHLHGTPVNINVESVWNQSITGSGSVIAIVDDGLQKEHADIRLNYRASSSYDFNFHDSDPSPDFVDDTHGTSAAGVAAARDNSECGVGSAYRAQLAGLRILSSNVYDADEAAALSYKNNENQIYSNSWGPTDDGKRLEGMGPLLQLAMEQSINTGRNGRGSIYIWAGGNGRTYGDNCNYDGYANSRFTIAIGALDYLGGQAYYSESCAMLVVSAPSSGSGKSITTTDLIGLRGADPTNCRSNFGGTSSAAPLVAGVVALMLEVNPRLGWRDVQAILIETATKTSPNDLEWKMNGAGYLVNHKFGFGLINAAEAVNLARQWANLGTYQSISGEISPHGTISEGRINSFTLSFSSNFRIEHVEIELDITHPQRGDLAISLISPFGTESILAEQRSDTNENIVWTFGTIRNWGESPRGVWTLRIIDSLINGNSGVLNKWQLNIYGH